METAYEWTDPQTLIQEVIDHLNFLEGFDQIDFQLKIDGDKIYADRFRLKIILNNLISNAIKFHLNIDQKKRFIKVVVNADEHQYSICVRDNGIGIEKQYLDRVFDMFFRASRHSTGSGLGLFIAHESAKRMGGDLTVKSKSGKGSDFELKVPYMTLQKKA